MNAVAGLNSHSLVFGLMNPNKKGEAIEPKRWESLPEDEADLMFPQKSPVFSYLA